MASRATSISFIGLGRMGAPMARNLFKARFAMAPSSSSGEASSGLVVCDARLEAAQTFAREFELEHPGARVQVVNTPEEATLRSRTVFTMLPSSPHVQEVYTGASSVLSALKQLPVLSEAEQADMEYAQTLCVDSTTLDVDVARAVASQIIAAGAQMVDAPVSGGVRAAVAGTLTFLIGGTSSAYTLASPLLTPLSSSSSRIFHTGPSGAGLVAKIVNNLILGVQQVVAGEAMLLGVKMGLQPDVLREVVMSCTGASWSMGVNNPVRGAVRTDGETSGPPSEKGYEGGFATALMLKDMGLARHAASTAGVRLPLGEVAERIYERVIANDPPAARKDFSIVYQYLEQLAAGSANVIDARLGVEEGEVAENTRSTKL